MEASRIAQGRAPTSPLDRLRGPGRGALRRQRPRQPFALGSGVGDEALREALRDAAIESEITRVRAAWTRSSTKARET
jgi:hypothetical protein